MRETQILRGLGKARMAAQSNHFAHGFVPGRKSPLHSLRAGAAMLRGPGTATSDSIHANLSKGEAVLPAKTTQAIGPENIAAVIKATTGKAPKQGLRAGGHYALGALDTTAVPGIQTGEASMEDFNAAKRPAFDQPRSLPKSPMPPMGDTTTHPRVLAPELQTTANAPEGVAPQTPTPQSAAPRPQRAGWAGAWDKTGGRAGDWVNDKLTPGAAKPAPVTPPASSGVNRPFNAPTSGPLKTMAMSPNTILNTFRAGDDIGMVAAHPNADGVEKTLAGAEALGNVAGGYLVDRVKGGLNSLLGTGFNLGNDSRPITALGHATRTFLGAKDPRTGLEQMRDSFPGGAPTPSLASVAAQTARGNGVPLPTATPVAAPAAPAPAPAPTPAAPVAEAPSAGRITKTVDANGNTTYSGGDVSGAIDLRNGQGKELAPGGGYLGVNDGSGSYGGGLASRQAELLNNPGVVAALRAAAARGDTDAVNSVLGGGQGGGQNAGNLLVQQIQRGLAGGQRLTRAGAAALQGLDTNNKNYASSMYGHDISRTNSREGHDVEREGHNLTYQSNVNRLGLDRARLLYEMGQAGSKKLDDDNMLSPYATDVGKDGVQAPSAARANELGQFLKANSQQFTDGSGKPIDMGALSQSNPARYHQLRSAAEAQYGLGRKMNDYAGNTIFGQASGWAGPKITDLRDMNVSDFTKGSSLTDSLLSQIKAGNYKKGVEVDVGGRKQVVPLGELLGDKQNGGQYRAMINQWLQSKGRPVLGDNFTGE